jgi:DNA-binding NarL/FixJ family response regulator
VDAALISVKLPGESALELTRTILDSSPSTRVLALGLSDDQEDVLKYIEAGAAGYILKDSSLHDLVEAVRSTQRGEAHLSPHVAGAILQRLSSLARVFSRVEDRLEEDIHLTPREIEVLQCIAEGLTNQEIARRLLLEVGTVKNHVHNILEKLNVPNREAAAFYLTFIRSNGQSLGGEHHESSSRRIPH